MGDYQKLQFASNGAFGSRMHQIRGSNTKMMACNGDGDHDHGSFFDIETKKLDDSWSGTMKELVGDKKAILIVNVASE